MQINVLFVGFHCGKLRTFFPRAWETPLHPTASRLSSWRWGSDEDPNRAFSVKGWGTNFDKMSISDCLCIKLRADAQEVFHLRSDTFLTIWTVHTTGAATNFSGAVTWCVNIMGRKKVNSRGRQQLCSNEKISGDVLTLNSPAGYVLGPHSL